MSSQGLKIGAKYKLTKTDGNVVVGVLRDARKTMFGDMLLNVMIDDVTYGVAIIDSLEIVSE